jgi:beta-glucosidase
VARVQGFQGEDLSATNTILTCAKHFLGYAFGRWGTTVAVSGVNTEYIFPSFKAAAMLV